MDNKMVKVRKKWTIKRALKIILVTFILILLCTVLLYSNKMRTLTTLKEVDSHPLYVMKYYGSYGFDDYLKVGSKNNKELGDFLNEKMLNPISLNSINNKGFACTTFSTKDDKNNFIFGRNYDYSGTYKSLLLFTSPPGGYRSVSMVNVNGFGNTDKAPITSLENRMAFLSAPYFPYDGMNEYGVVISVNTVSTGQASNDQAKKTIGFPQAIRLVLDHAKNTNEAISLLEKYNIDFVINIPQPIHFHIADSSGKSAVVEYVDGKTQVQRSDDSWSIATNFVFYPIWDPDDRYNIVNNELKKTSGSITKENAMSLLEKTSQEQATNWSVVYNQTTGDVQVVMGRKYDKVLNFKLEMAN